jgi:hypothetical protein
MVANIFFVYIEHHAICCIRCRMLPVVVGRQSVWCVPAYATASWFSQTLHTSPDFSHISFHLDFLEDLVHPILFYNQACPKKKLLFAFYLPARNTSSCRPLCLTGSQGTNGMRA